MPVLAADKFILRENFVSGMGFPPTAFEVQWKLRSRASRRGRSGVFFSFFSELYVCVL